MTAWQLPDASHIARTQGLPAFLSTQAEYNLLSRQAEETLFATLHEIGKSFLPHFPLANGLLTGKYLKGEDIPEGPRVAQPLMVSVIAEATTPEQVQANAATRAWKLSQDDLAKIDGLCLDDEYFVETAVVQVLESDALSDLRSFGP